MKNYPQYLLFPTLINPRGDNEFLLPEMTGLIFYKQQQQQ